MFWKYLYQILVNGWSDIDTWSFDDTMVDFIIPQLERYKEFAVGENADGLIEEIDEILFIFKTKRDDHYPICKEWDEAWEKFGKIAPALWW